MTLQSTHAMIASSRRAPRRIALLVSAVTALLLTACPEDVSPPRAVIAVLTESPAVGSVVELDGSLSSGRRGGALAFEWRFMSVPANSEAEFNDSRLQAPSFVADRAGTYQVELVVNNGFSDSSPALAEIVVSGCGANVPTVTSITPSPADGGVGETVRFTAAIADDDNADDCALEQTFSFDWRLVDLPTDSQTTLNDGNLASPWMVPDISGEYTVELSVTDSAGLTSAPLSITIDTTPCGEATPSVDSVTATPSDPDLGETVNLTAVVSDADNVNCGADQEIFFQWAFSEAPPSSQATIQRADLADAWFIPDVDGNYVVELRVTDSTGRTSLPGGTTISAGDAPVDLTVTATPETGQLPLTVAFTCTSPTGDAPVRYAWSFGNGDVSNQQNPSYTFTTRGVFTATCVATDVDGDFDTASVDITVVDDTAPEVSVAANPKVGVVDLAVSFATIVNGGDGTISYSWDFGDDSGATSTAANPTHTYTTVGVFPAVVTVTDEDGDSDSALIEISAGDDDTPAVAIDADPTTGVAELEVQFSSSTAGGNDPLSFDWDFGDGTTHSRLQNPVHVYETGGQFAASLTVTDVDGDPAQAGVVIDVEDDDTTFVVTATATPADPNGLAPLLVGFDCDVTGADNQPLTYSWTFGDGNTSQLQSPSHVYVNPGDYVATCTATDSDGDFFSDTADVTAVEDTAPAVTLTADQTSGVSPIAIGDITFTASADGGNPPLRYDWDFGNGSTVDDGSASETNPAQYTQGTYVAAVSVTDVDGDTARDTLIISVDPDNDNVEVVATATPRSGLTPLTVQFGALATGGNGPLSFEWDFEGTFGSNLQNPVHVFETAGTYNVVVTASDVDDGQDTDTIQIIVDDDIAPTIGTLTATADEPAALAGLLLAPLKVNFVCVGQNGNGPLAVRWEFGDGQISNLGTVSHTYASGGTYTPTCTVTDSDGDEVSGSPDFVPGGAVDPVTVNADSTPQVTITAGSLTGAAPLVVDFDSIVTGGNGLDANPYSWSFGDPAIAAQTVANPTAVTYNTPGTYQVTFSVKDQDGDVGSDSVTVVVGTNSQPQAFIEASVTRGVADLDVDFAAVVAGGDAPFTFEWDFDSTGTVGTVDSTLQFPPTQTFDTTSLVALRVTDADGSTDTATQTITIDADDTPDVTTTADCGFPAPGQCTQGLAPLVVEFECDATGTNDPFTYVWNFGDGSTSTEQNPIHVYQNTGTFDATCVATDADDDDSVIDGDATQTIAVNANTTPVVTVSASPTSGVTPHTVTFNSSVVGGEAPLTYSWNFGDTNTTSGVNLTSVTHPYTGTGVFIATLTVTDDNNDVGSDTVAITVQPNSSPTVVASANPTSGVTPLTVNFAANAVSGNAPLSFQWNFDNGGSTNDSSAPNPTFVYENPGTFDATVTVTDIDGESATDSVTIVVNADVAPQNVVLTATPDSGQAPLGVSFDCDFDRGNGAQRVEFSFGDGASSAFNNVAGNSTSASHTYNVQGSYTATCVVIDADGDSASGNDDVTVTANQAPVAAIIAPQDPCLTGGFVSRLDAGTATSNPVGSFDPDGDPLTYQWQFTSVPGVSIPAFLPSSTVRAPQFTPTDLGFYTVVLTVSDGQLTDSAELTFEVRGITDFAAVTSQALIDTVDATTTLTVQLENECGGAVEGFGIDWVAGGDADVDPTSSNTNSSGQASTTATFGSGMDTVTATAGVTGLTVDFALTGTGTNAVVTVTPDPFVAGTDLTITVVDDDPVLEVGTPNGTNETSTRKGPGADDDQITVVIVCANTGDTETVTLDEVTQNSFSGMVPTEEGAKDDENGTLQCNEVDMTADEATATYVDPLQDDGAENQAVSSAPVTMATCNDGKKNQGETDIDCGGNTTCPRCADGDECNDGTDCQSDACEQQSPSLSICVSCFDGLQNQDETDVDCGGDACGPTCEFGEGCTVAAPDDCVSGFVCDIDYPAPNGVADGSCNCDAGEPDATACFVTSEVSGTAFDIQAAIDAVADGGTVLVPDGNYVEDLDIYKAVTVNSQNGASTTTIEGVAVVDGADFPLAVPNIDIQANDVRISGFTIRSPTVGATEYSSGIVLTGTDIEIDNNDFFAATGDISQAIQTWKDDLADQPGAPGDISGLSIHDNTFQENALIGTGLYEAIYINTQTDVVAAGNPIVIQANTFQGALIRGVRTDRESVDITDNSFTTTGSTIFTDFPMGIQVKADDVDIQMNEFTSFQTAVVVDLTDPNATVTSNCFEDSNSLDVRYTGSNELDASESWWGTDETPVTDTPGGGTINTTTNQTSCADALNGP